MPSNTSARSTRALALGLALTLAGSVVTSGSAAADRTEPATATIRDLSRVVATISVAVPERRAPRPAVAPLPAVYRHADAHGSSDLAAAPQPSVRDRIAARCPELHDPELLRDGAAADGRGLCERSVRAARSDVAAAAVVEGFELLGLPYSRSRRGKDGYDDCSSFVGRSYREAGRPLSDSDWEPSSSAMRNAGWATSVDDTLPGDILWRRGHVAIALADGYMMHASRSGDVTHVRTAGRYSRVLAVDPAT